MAWNAALNPAKSGGHTRVFDVTGLIGDAVADIPHGLPVTPDDYKIVPYGPNGAGAIIDQLRITTVDAVDVGIGQTGAVLTANLSMEVHVGVKHSIIR